MITIQEDAKIIFYSKPINLIKSIDGLAAVVQNELGMELNANEYFLFCNFKRDRFKILYKDGANLAIWFRRFKGTLAFQYTGKTIFLTKDGFLEFLSQTRSRIGRRAEKNNSDRDRFL